MTIFHSGCPQCEGICRPAGTRIVLCADGLQQSFQRSYPQHQAQRAIAVIGINPVHAGTKKQTGCGGDRFVSCAGNLEINLILALELDFAIVKFSRQIHGAVHADERVAIEAMHFLSVGLGNFDAGL